MEGRLWCVTVEVGGGESRETWSGREKGKKGNGQGVWREYNRVDREI